MKDGLSLNISSENYTQAYRQLKYKQHWWSYNHLDSDSPNSKSKSIPKVLFTQFETQDKKSIYLKEALADYQNLPKNWNFQIIDPDILNEAKECYKLKVLIEKLKSLNYES